MPCVKGTGTPSVPIPALHVIHKVQESSHAKERDEAHRRRCDHEDRGVVLEVAHQWEKVRLKRAFFRKQT